MYYSMCRKALGQCCLYEACQVRKEAALSLVQLVPQVDMKLDSRSYDRDFFLTLKEKGSNG